MPTPFCMVMHPLPQNLVGEVTAPVAIIAIMEEPITIMELPIVEETD